MKCSICNEKVNRFDEICPNCKNHLRENKRTNADKLEILAHINLIITIIGAVFVFINCSIVSISEEDTINWIGMLIGIGIIITGLTLFYLLKTIIDIYNEIDE